MNEKTIQFLQTTLIFLIGITALTLLMNLIWNISMNENSPLITGRRFIIILIISPLAALISNRSKGSA